MGLEQCDVTREGREDQRERDGWTPLSPKPAGKLFGILHFFQRRDFSLGFPPFSLTKKRKKKTDYTWFKERGGFVLYRVLDFFFFLTVFSPRLLWRWVKCSTLLSLSLSVSLSIARYENAAKTSLFSLFSPPPPPLTRASADIYWSFEPLRRLSDTLFSPTFFFLYGSDRSGVCACSPVCGCCWTGLSLHNETSSLSYL